MTIKKRMMISVYATVLALASGTYADLKEHWRLDEISGGTAYNSAGYIDGRAQSQSGFFIDGTWMPTQGLEGALELQNNQRVLIAPSINLSTDSFTVMGWIKPYNQGVYANSWSRFICSSHIDGFYLGVWHPGAVWGFCTGLGYGGNVVTGPPISINKWQHVAGVYNSAFNTVTIYVNGTAYGPVTAAGPNQPNQTIFIGSDFRLGDPSLIGLYDDIAIYNEALSGATIYNIYQSGLAGRPINYWQATNPFPPDNATEQPINVSLMWSPDPNAPAPIANHILYYGTDPGDVFNSNESTQVGDTRKITLPAATTIYSPLDLTRDMILYWRVDEKIDASRQARGAIWTFSTISSLTITQQPRNQRADAGVGDSVTFTVEAISESPIKYEWYKNGVAIPESNSSQLTISDVEASDAGEYYVVLTNSVGSKTSDTALLLIKGLLGHWPLDGNPNDISGYGNNGTMYNDPNFVTGIAGQALLFNRLNQQRVEIPNEAHFDIYDEFTASFWVNGNNLNQLAWATMFGKGGNNGGWNINKFDELDFPSAHMDPNPDLGNNDTPSWVAWGCSILDEEWHLITFVFDGTTESLYIDGEVKQFGPAAEAFPNDIPVIIGATRTGSAGQDVVAYFNGLIDDVRIYNYALSPSEIGQLYFDITGIPVCVKQPVGDTDNDCNVDLADFANLARDWMACGLIPATQCP